MPVEYLRSHLKSFSYIYSYTVIDHSASLEFSCFDLLPLHLRHCLLDPDDKM